MGARGLRREMDVTKPYKRSHERNSENFKNLIFTIIDSGEPYLCYESAVPVSGHRMWPYRIRLFLCSRVIPRNVSI